MGSTVSPAGVSGAGGPLGLGVSRMMAKEPVVESFPPLSLGPWKPTGSHHPQFGDSETLTIPPNGPLREGTDPRSSSWPPVGP